MRALAVWDPDSLPGIDDEGLSDTDRAHLGLLPGIRSPDSLGEPLDRDPGWRAAEARKGDELVTEGKDGIRLFQHPEVLLLSEEALWGPVGAWRSGSPRDLSREDFEAKTNFWLDCWAEMLGAWCRASASSAPPTGASR